MNSYQLQQKLINSAISVQFFLCLRRLLERAVGLVDLVIPGLLCLRELEPLEVAERSSGSAGDDALVKGILLPLLVDLGRGPGLADGAGACAVSNGDLVLHETHVFELHGLAGDA